MSFVIDDGQALAQLSSIIRRLEDPVPYFDFVGAEQLHLVQKRIMSGKADPQGAPWAPWAFWTATERHDKGNAGQGLMWDTGELLKSFRYEVDGVFEVDIGTDTWYAQRHQDGFEPSHLPKRELMGWDSNSILHYANAFVSYLEGRPL